MNEEYAGVTGLDSVRLRGAIASAASRIKDKLASLDITCLGISEYNQRYLGMKIQYADATLNLYGRLLYLALARSAIVLEDFVVVDYGGGSGLIALLAQETGIGTVAYNDIYDVSCQDVQKLSSALELELEHVVPGDVEDLALYLRRASISVDAIISNDVIEHIYDLEAHFRTLATSANHPLRAVYATGANVQNYRYTREAREQQIQVEHEDREPQWGHKERDTLQAYLNVRRNLISEYAPGLEPEQVKMLARATRGLMKQDIEKCVDEYHEKGSISYQPNHPTNTCDPLTGNWCEHLMEFDWLERVVRSEGFSVSIIPGMYCVSGSFIKRIAKNLINTLLRFFGRRGMFLAPYFVVLAESKPD